MATYDYSATRWVDRSPSSTLRNLTLTSNVSVVNSVLPENTVISATVARGDTPSSEGTAFNATNMNALETRIKNAFLPCMTYTVLYNSSNGTEGNITLPADTLNCKLLEFFYNNDQKIDGITSQKIYITNYNSNNRISLDQITCGVGSGSNNFYFKTATYNIKKQTNSNNVIASRETNKTKRLVYDNGSFSVETAIDLKVFTVIGYRTDNI